MFPEFVKVDAYEVDCLVWEHARIRQLAAEIGVEVDLHALRLAHAEEFITLLRAHADREGRLVYRWAEVKLLKSHPRTAARLA